MIDDRKCNDVTRSDLKSITTLSFLSLLSRGLECEANNFPFLLQQNRKIFIEEQKEENGILSKKS